LIVNFKFCVWTKLVFFQILEPQKMANFECLVSVIDNLFVLTSFSLVR